MKENTLYDILGVKQDASALEIRLAYEVLRKRCEDNVAGLREEDRRVRMTVLRQTFETLSDPTAKSIYDAKLRGPSLPDAWSRVADVGAGASEAGTGSRKETNWTAIGVRTLLGIAGIWLISQVSYVFIVSRYITNNPPPADAVARDRAIIQDYYQETGVRAASAAEVEMLRLADRRAEKERRQNEAVEREKDKAQRDYERFLADSKRVGEQVSADLHRAELERQYEDERVRREAEMAQRQRAEAEAVRVERERARWRAVLNDRKPPNDPETD